MRYKDLFEEEETFKEFMSHPDRDMDYFISFRDIPTFDINPNYGSESNGVTPAGIYAFPYYWIRKAPTNTVHAYHKRKYALTFSVSPNATIFKNDTYNNLKNDLDKLDDLNNHYIHKLINDVKRNDYHFKGGYASRDTLWKVTEWICDEKLGIRTNNEPYKAHPQKPEMWRKLLMDLGIDMIYDEGWLTGDILRQIVVLNTNIMENKKIFEINQGKDNV